MDGKYFARNFKLLKIINNLSFRDIALSLNVSHTTLFKYETGDILPGLKIMTKIANYFNLKIDDFLSENFSFLNIEDTFYRTKGNSLPTQEEEHTSQCLIIEEVKKFLSLLIQLDNRKFAVPKIEKLTISSEKDAFDAGKKMRKILNLGGRPIDNLIDTLEDFNIIVLLLNLPENVDGAQGFVGKYPFIALSSSIPGDRQRFTLCHELSHLFFDLDMKKLQQEYNESNETLISEKIANRFAGAFLVPDEIIAYDLGNNRDSLSWYELRLLKEKYKVSMQTIILRAYQSNIISRDTRNYWYDFFEEKDFRQTEPFPIEQEKPTKFIKLLCEAITSEKITFNEAAKLVGTSEKDFRDEFFL